jgi:acetyltransferase-like isoleucine patch superfamily enzyme
MIYKIFIKITIIASNILSNIKVSFYKMVYGKRFNCKPNLYIGKRFSLLMDHSKSALEFGENIQFRNDVSIRVIDDSNLSVGNKVFFNNDCSINCMYDIRIGDNSLFGESVKIYDHNHQYRNNNSLINDQGYVKGKVVIGSNCWIGSNVVILKDVEIGNNVVIGAGCVIFKSIPANSIVYNNQNLTVTQNKV